MKMLLVEGTQGRGKVKEAIVLRATFRKGDLIKA
jgi:hypothetical protein